MGNKKSEKFHKSAHQKSQLSSSNNRVNPKLRIARKGKQGKR